MAQPPKSQSAVLINGEVGTNPRANPLVLSEREAKSLVNFVPEDRALSCRYGAIRRGYVPPAGLSTPKGARALRVKDAEQVVAAWLHTTDNTIYCYAYNPLTGTWTALNSGYGFIPGTPHDLSFASVRTREGRVVIMQNGIDFPRVWWEQDGVARLQYFIEAPASKAIVLMGGFYPTPQGGAPIDGRQYCWFGYNNQSYTNTTGRLTLSDLGGGTPNGQEVTLTATTSCAAGDTAYVSFTAKSLTGGRQLFIAASDVDTLLDTFQVEIYDSSSGYSTIWHPSSVADGTGAIRKSPNWAALSLDPLQSEAKDSVTRIRFTYRKSTSPSATLAIRIHGVRLSGNVAGDSVYSFTYYSDTQRLESVPTVPQALDRAHDYVNTGGSNPVNYFIPFSGDFFYYNNIIHFFSGTPPYKLNIYRASPGGEYYLVAAEQPLLPGTTTLSDNLPDEELDTTRIRPSDGFYPLPIGRYMEVINGCLVVGDVTLWTPAEVRTLRTLPSVAAGAYSLTTQPPTPCRLRAKLDAVIGSISFPLTFSGKDQWGNSISETLSMSDSVRVQETTQCFASVSPGGMVIGTVSGGGSASLTISNGSYEAYPDRFYVSSLEDPLRFVRLPDAKDPTTGSFTSVGTGQIVGMRATGQGGLQRLYVATSTNQLIAFQGADPYSLTRERDRRPASVISSKCMVDSDDALLFVDMALRLRSTSYSNVEVFGDEIYMELRRCTSPKNITMCLYDDRLWLAFRRDHASLNDQLYMMNLRTGLWTKLEDTSQALHRPHHLVPFHAFETRALLSQSEGGYMDQIWADTRDLTQTFTASQYTTMRCSATSRELRVGLREYVVPATMWLECEAVVRRIGDTAAWQRMSGSTARIAYDVTAELTAGTTRVSFDGGGTWRTVTAASFAGGVTTITFDGPALPAGNYTGVFSTDLKLTVQDVESLSSYSAWHVNTQASGRCVVVLPVKTERPLLCHGIMLSVDAYTDAAFRLYVAGIDYTMRERHEPTGGVL